MTDRIRVIHTNDLYVAFFIVDPPLATQRRSSRLAEPRSSPRQAPRGGAATICFCFKIYSCTRIDPTSAITGRSVKPPTKKQSRRAGCNPLLELIRKRIPASRFSARFAVCPSVKSGLTKSKPKDHRAGLTSKRAGPVPMFSLLCLRNTNDKLPSEDNYNADT